MNNPWNVAQQLSLPEWMTPELYDALNREGLMFNKDGMLMLHQRTKEKLDHFKALEMEYRKVCAKILVEKPKEGMNTVELGNGYQAKVGIKYNYKLDSNNDKVWEGLEKIEKIGNQGKFIAERLVSWTPNFLLSEYRKLQEDAQDGSQEAKQMLEAINEFMTITEAAPTLEIREPKAKK